jgi:multiple sugar transport system ATP-binding protein
MSNLILKNVYKRYNNKKKSAVKNDFAVNGLSLECKEGEFVGILGPSGCGKTTTLRMIAGLEDITDGEIFVGNTVINNIHPKDRQIGLAFEDYALYPPLSVYENIAFNLRAKNINKDEIHKRIMKIAPLLKVDELLDRKPAGLSGGQKQRVNIARAIVREPQLLLLDEPLSHLDGKMRQTLRTEIKRLHREIKCTTIIVTHDQLEAMSLADRIAIMNDGKLQQFGTPLEIYDNPVNEFVAGFIGEPPMNLNKVFISKLKEELFFSFPGSEVIIAVPKKYYSVLGEGMEVKLGIRPTDLLLGKEDGSGSAATVAVFENLGEERTIGVRIGEGYLTLITSDERRYRKGDKIKLEVKEDKTHIFDVATGNRIRAV